VFVAAEPVSVWQLPQKWLFTPLSWWALQHQCLQLPCDCEHVMSSEPYFNRLCTFSTILVLTLDSKICVTLKYHPIRIAKEWTFDIKMAFKFISNLFSNRGRQIVKYLIFCFSTPFFLLLILETDFRYVFCKCGTFYFLFTFKMNRSFKIYTNFMFIQIFQSFTNS